jgi:hypothetical protein
MSARALQQPHAAYSCTRVQLYYYNSEYQGTKFSKYSSNSLSPKSS